MWRKVLRRMSQAVFTVWVVTLFLIATLLAAKHLYVLPSPDANDLALALALQGLTGNRTERSWSVVHVLYARCRCSKSVLQHLAQSQRPRAVIEHVLLAGTPSDEVSVRKLLTARGFSVHLTEPENLRKRYHVESAPLLLVTDGAKAVRYAGGYSERKQSLDLQDVQIIRGLMTEQKATRLPIFGCAVSRELQRLMDPLSLATASGL